MQLYAAPLLPSGRDLSLQSAPDHRLWATPDGTLVVEGVGPSDPTGTLGQGEGYGCTGIWTCTASSYTACSDWKLNLINNSDTEIVEFTFSPPAGTEIIRP